MMGEPEQELRAARDVISGFVDGRGVAWAALNAACAKVLESAVSDGEAADPASGDEGVDDTRGHDRKSDRQVVSWRSRKRRRKASTPRSAAVADPPTPPRTETPPSSKEEDMPEPPRPQPPPPPQQPHQQQQPAAPVPAQPTQPAQVGPGLPTAMGAPAVTAANPASALSFYGAGGMGVQLPKGTIAPGQQMAVPHWPPAAMMMFAQQQQQQQQRQPAFVHQPMPFAPGAPAWALAAAAGMFPNGSEAGRVTAPGWPAGAAAWSMAHQFPAFAAMPMAAMGGMKAGHMWGGAKPTGASGKANECIICSGATLRSRNGQYCSPCYCGVYNDLGKVLTKYSKRHEPLPFTGHLDTDLAFFVTELRTLRRGCRANGACPPEAYAHDVAMKCTRCRTLACVTKLPQMCHDIMRKGSKKSREMIEHADRY